MKLFSMTMTRKLKISVFIFLTSCFLSSPAYAGHSGLYFFIFPPVLLAIGFSFLIKYLLLKKKFEKVGWGKKSFLLIIVIFEPILFYITFLLVSQAHIQLLSLVIVFLLVFLACLIPHFFIVSGGQRPTFEIIGETVVLSLVFPILIFILGLISVLLLRYL